jgi:hypothetical protein
MKVVLPIFPFAPKPSKIFGIKKQKEKQLREEKKVSDKRTAFSLF